MDYVVEEMRHFKYQVQYLVFRLYL